MFSVAILPLHLLSEAKMLELQTSSSFPRFYIAVEGWRYEKSSHATFYTVEVGMECEDQVVTFTFEKRYSELLKIHKSLAKESQTSLCSFPPKHVFSHHDLEFVRSRQKGLQTYFKCLHSIPDLFKRECMKRYFASEQIFKTWANVSLQKESSLISDEN